MDFHKRLFLSLVPMYIILPRCRKPTQVILNITSMFRFLSVLVGWTVIFLKIFFVIGKRVNFMFGKKLLPPLIIQACCRLSKFLRGIWWLIKWEQKPNKYVTNVSDLIWPCFRRLLPKIWFTDYFFRIVWVAGQARRLSSMQKFLYKSLWPNIFYKSQRLVYTMQGIWQLWSRMWLIGKMLEAYWIV